MDYRLRLSGYLYRAALAKAGSPAALQALLREHLTRYVAGTSWGAQGGRARALALTPERRRAIALLGAQARLRARVTAPTAPTEA